MELHKNIWLIPLLALLITFGVSTVRIYTYIDGVLTAYSQSFHVDNTDNYVYWTFHTRELQRLIDEIADKKAAVQKQQDDLGAWEARLASEKTELTAMRTELEKFRSSITTIIVQSDASEAKNLKTLAATYTIMNPESTVGILNDMDENTAVKILALMKPDTVGPIFETMAKIPGQEGQMRARIARLSEKLRLYKQAQP